MVQILGTPKVQYFKTGTVDYLAGGKLWSYEAGTTTLKSTYPSVSDALALTNANTNPITLDARGEADVVLNGATKLILRDSAGNIIWTKDNLDQITSDIFDANSNEVLRFGSSASAVNEITITNASTTNAPIVAATGGDTNVSLKVTSKNAGTLLLDAGATGTIDLGTSSTGQINLRRNTSVTGTLAVSTNATITGTMAVTGATTLTGAATINNTLTVSGAVNFMPVGCILPYGGTSAPTGFLSCDGTAVSRTGNPLLFAAIGTTWGSGDGSTTFNLPNLNRKALMGVGGSGTAVISNTVGSTGGVETYTLTSANMPTAVPIATAGVASALFTGGATFLAPYSTGWSGGSATAISLVQPSSIVMFIVRAI